MGSNFYIEPFGRAGYPFAFSVGLYAGIRLPWAKKERLQEGEDFKDGIRLTRDNDNNLRIQVTSIIFRPNHADFEDLSEDVQKANNTTLSRVAGFLKENKGYKVIVEGHANPTTPRGPARTREEASLKILSEQRAVMAVQSLVLLGIERNRMSHRGMGISKMLVAYDDQENNWKNRRVEFILTE